MALGGLIACCARFSRSLCAEVLARRQYLRHVAHWLGYDELAEGAGITRDAADAAVAELVARVRSACSTFPRHSVP